MQIKATKTLRYARNIPHLPHVMLTEGTVYDDKSCPIDVALLALATGGAVELVEKPVSEPVTEEPVSEPVTEEPVPTPKSAKGKK